MFIIVVLLDMGYWTSRQNPDFRIDGRKQHLKSGDEASKSREDGRLSPAWQADMCASELQGVRSVGHPALRLQPTADESC